MARWEETKRQKFIRLATKRTNLVIKKLEVLGKLSNRGNYSYNEKDVEQIFSAIHEKVGEVAEMFSGKRPTKMFRLETDE
jgi:hypothetical protein